VRYIVYYQRTILQYSKEMDKLTAEEIAEFREIFNLVDKDGQGSINKAELAELMETLGIKADPEEIDQMIAEIDQGIIRDLFFKIIYLMSFCLDGNGDIDFEEFVAVMSRKVNASYTSDQVKSAFKIFEVPGQNGMIKVEALIKALCTYGTEKLSEAQAKELISQLEADANGMVNFVDYVNMMMTS
jgi:calmodulin